MKQAGIYELLQEIYNGNLGEHHLQKFTKEELIDFILEVFNKGILKDYLNSK